MKNINLYEEKKPSSEDLKWKLNSKYVSDHYKEFKEDLKDFAIKNKKIAKKLLINSKDASEDLITGKVFSDDTAALNLKDTLIDITKVLGQGAIFVLPGGSIGLLALRRLLKTKGSEKLGIDKLLTLSFDVLENPTENKKIE